MLVISFIGRTYPHKDRLKAFGARWDGKCWVIRTEDRALEDRLRTWCNTVSNDAAWVGITVLDNEGPRYTKLPTRAAKGNFDTANWSSKRMRAHGAKMFRKR
ncbi:hypothetical protein [Azospirillum sp. sgz301742]